VEPPEACGSLRELFWLRKEGTAACVISGYPAVTFYQHGRHLAMKVDAVPNLENETMGVTVGRRPPMVRLSASGGIASFWVFGNDNMSRCINASQMVITVRSLTGRAAVPAPSVYSLWPCCGDAVPSRHSWLVCRAAIHHALCARKSCLEVDAIRRVTTLRELVVTRDVLLRYGLC
jgi:hypothetical protein